jgi:hypothetical protein
LSDAYDSTGRKLPVKKLGQVSVPYDHLGRYIKEMRASSLKEVRSAFDKLQAPHWVFRGQSDSQWELLSSIERAVGTRLHICEAEARLLSQFKSRAHLLTSNLPVENDDLEWLALMQHHGCPTRLLDFTASPYVALYFALESINTADTCAIWAINRRACDERAIDRIKILQEWSNGPLLNKDDLLHPDLASRLSSAGVFQRAVLSNQAPFICSAKPTRQNERLASQQGLFLCPGDLGLFDFPSNLMQQISMGKFPEHFWPAWNPAQIVKVVIPNKNKVELLGELHRMNIDRSTLFPGLDGYAQSLAVSLRFDNRSTIDQPKL